MVMTHHRDRDQAPRMSAAKRDAARLALSHAAISTLLGLRSVLRATAGRIPLRCASPAHLRVSTRGSTRGVSSRVSSSCVRACVLSVLRRNGLHYGVKIRAPHALVMTFLFKANEVGAVCARACVRSDARGMLWEASVPRPLDCHTLRDARACCPLPRPSVPLALARPVCAASRRALLVSFPLSPAPRQLCVRSRPQPVKKNLLQILKMSFVHARNLGQS